ncbi:TPA: hypothetical protein ACLFZF_003108 [Klebsiella aerogenes]
MLMVVKQELPNREAPGIRPRREQVWYLIKPTIAVSLLSLDGAELFALIAALAWLRGHSSPLPAPNGFQRDCRGYPGDKNSQRYGCKMTSMNADPFQK